MSNTAIGDYALFGNTGSYNVSFGDSALYVALSGNYNIELGSRAGRTSSISTSNTLYISDSTYHMKYRLDSATSISPNIIGKDVNGL